MLLDGLRLVEPLQRAIVPLVQAPAALHRDPHAVHFVLNQPERTNRALQDRGVGDVDGDAFAQQFLACLARLGDALRGQIDVGPAGEEVVDVPRALAVANEDEFAGSAGFASHAGAA